ncbi:polysaccharide deacetylase family protein [Salidesulfovibrio brasiliensis]|uniref:polysaccharide deacetylase family protein n=1 Tax=Salidesulfovibrio brasiliensis TaxID=221711 RepID=UPI0006D0D402|nr:polysaccharide deacetylase family protein [Salidesulfovibrio brasiliensis]
MIIRPGISALWNEPFPELSASLDAVLARAPKGMRIFFRADDIAVPSKLFSAMIDPFREHEAVLEMAVTPAWLRHDHAAELLRQCPEASIFRFHQHGWRHANHQQSGKKGEFGTDRTKEAKQDDLRKGRDKLSAMLGRRFEPRFTPPWNRFDTETGEILLGLGYRNVSRSNGEQRKVPLPKELPDLFINVDLHTRTEASPEAGRAALLAELGEAVRTGYCGVMLHHQRMNRHSLVFLDELLAALNRAGIPSLGFAELLANSD